MHFTEGGKMFIKKRGAGRVVEQYVRRLVEQDARVARLGDKSRIGLPESTPRD